MHPRYPQNGSARLLTALLAAIWLFGQGGCGRSPRPSDNSDNATLNVVCTTGQVADMVRNIGGRHVTVESLMGSGVDPHLYKATPGDVRKLFAADVVFYSGLHLEGRLADLLRKLGRRRPVYAISEDLHENHAELLRKVPGSQDTHDPHIWFDVSLWARCVDFVAERLADLDPEHAEDYHEKAEEYAAELQTLHESCKQRLATIPKQLRVMVTAHDAFGYFGDAYDVEVHGLQGISTADEADLAGANALVKLLVARKIKAVFVESSVPPKNVQSLIQACEAEGHRVTVGGELFSDAMGPEGSPEGTYVGMVEYNVKTIVGALK